MVRSKKSAPAQKQISEGEQERVRGLVIQNRALLYQISEADGFWSTYQLLAGASLHAIDLIGYLCYLVCSGIIEIRREEYKLLCHHRKEKSVQEHFGRERDYKAFQSFARDEKLAVLKKAGVGVNILLRTFFHLPGSWKEEEDEA
jgi:hypothetical protein